MKRVLNLLVALLLPCCVASLVHADDDGRHYRVEVIVFAHAEGRPDAREVTEIQSFSGFVDPLRQAAAAAEGDADSDDQVQAVLELIDTLATLEDDALAPAIPRWPEPYLALDRPGPTMQRALDRLERSPRHQVLNWLAWHQPVHASRPGPWVRVHDRHPVAVHWLQIEPTGTPSLHDPASGETAAVEPEFQYRLDGGIRLRQRQFMHLETDLHWRVPMQAPADEWQLPVHDDSGGQYRVHRLQQSRSVRAGRLEYFDSSWLGVLVLIEQVQPLERDEPEENLHHDSDSD